MVEVPPPLTGLMSVMAHEEIEAVLGEMNDNFRKLVVDHAIKN